MSNYNKPKKTYTFLLLSTGLLCIGAIIWLKLAGDKRTASDGNMTAMPHDSSSTVVVPDTTIDAGTLPSSSDSFAVAPTDSIGKDRRPPYEAGDEDGYLAGMDDGATHTPRASYDESNGFKTIDERTAYVRGYREGYAKGFEDGSKGRQFNISSNN